MRVLIIEDEKDLAMVLSEMLKSEGFETDEAYDGEQGLKVALTNIYDVIVLDVMLPKMNGIDVLKNMRTNGVSTSVLMLTAKAEIEDKVVALNNGADDYLTKPFNTKEFIARVKAMSRRMNKEYIENTITFEDITLDRQKHEVVKGSQRVKLTKKEFSILEMMMLNKGQIMSKEQLTAKTWGNDMDVEYNSIEVYVSFLRKKLTAIKSNVSIVTVRGLGYTLEVYK